MTIFVDFWRLLWQPGIYFGRLVAAFCIFISSGDLMYAHDELTGDR